MPTDAITFDATNTWRAMNGIAELAALGFNGLLLSTMQKAELEDLLKQWARDHDELVQRINAERRVA